MLEYLIFTCIIGDSSLIELISSNPPSFHSPALFVNIEAMRTLPWIIWQSSLRNFNTFCNTRKDVRYQMEMTPKWNCKSNKFFLNDLRRSCIIPTVLSYYLWIRSIAFVMVQQDLSRHKYNRLSKIQIESIFHPIIVNTTHSTDIPQHHQHISTNRDV